MWDVLKRLYVHLKVRRGTAGTLLSTRLPRTKMQSSTSVPRASATVRLGKAPALDIEFCFALVQLEQESSIKLNGHHRSVSESLIPMKKSLQKSLQRVNTKLCSL